MRIYRTRATIPAKSADPERATIDAPDVDDGSVETIGADAPVDAAPAPDPVEFLATDGEAEAAAAPAPALALALATVPLSALLAFWT